MYFKISRNLLSIFLSRATQVKHLQCARGPVIIDEHQDWRLKQHRLSGSDGEIIGGDGAGRRRGRVGLHVVDPRPALVLSVRGEEEAEIDPE